MRLSGRVLVIAGSDSGGGAGVQADIKTITAMGAYAASAITALTAQDTRAVHAILPVPPDFIARQIEVVLDDIGADVIKTGMLGEAAAIGRVCDVLAARAPDMPVVVDPVMRATSGARLLEDSALDTMKRRLLPIAAVLTPNVPEAEALAGVAIDDRAAMRRIAVALRAMGPAAVLLKGGHMRGETVVDVLASAGGVVEFAAPRIDSRHTHGTGCTLASAIAAGLAQEMELPAAIERARAYVRVAIETAPGFGAGNGPINHLISP